MTELTIKRIKAFIVDGLIIGIPLQIGTLFYWDYILKNHSEQILFYALTYQFVPFLLYWFISEYFFSATIGKKIFKLKVVVTSNRFFQIFLRTLVRLLPFDLFLVLINEKPLHDKLSKTSVEDYQK
mgnify:CR=1 FL=1